jgi:hypothetical protein
MAIISEIISGATIINIIESSNMVKTEYNVETESMIVEFKNGNRYEYEKVPHNIYTRFRMTQSQGKFFKTDIEKVYKFKKI